MGRLARDCRKATVTAGNKQVCRIASLQANIQQVFQVPATSKRPQRKLPVCLCVRDHDDDDDDGDECSCEGSIMAVHTNTPTALPSALSEPQSE